MERVEIWKCEVWLYTFALVNVGVGGREKKREGGRGEWCA